MKIKAKGKSVKIKTSNCFDLADKFVCLLTHLIVYLARESFVYSSVIHNLTFLKITELYLLL